MSDQTTADLVALALEDLAPTLRHRFQVTTVAAERMLWVQQGYSSVGFEVRRVEPPARLEDELVRIADSLSDFLSEAMAADGASNWPPCPLHPTSHPARALSVAGTASWVCPRDSTLIAPIGSYLRAR